MLIKSYFVFESKKSANHAYKVVLELKYLKSN